MKVMETVKTVKDFVLVYEDVTFCTRSYMLIGAVCGRMIRQKVKDAIEPYTYKKVKENVA